VHPLTFGPTKWDGPDHIVAVQWRAQAGDGYKERTFRRIAGPTKAYY
jgi:hypothetical protein